MLIYYLGRALLGLLSASLTAATLWLLVQLLQDGPDGARQNIRQLGPLADGTVLSSAWLTKTGALPGAVLGLVAAPYLGPLLGGLFSHLMGGTGAVITSLLPELGSLAVGIMAGLLGFALRSP